MSTIPHLSIRLSEEDRAHLDTLATAWGCSAAEAIRHLIRRETTGEPVPQPVSQAELRAAVILAVDRVGQAGLARDLGVAQATVSRWRSGDRRVPPDLEEEIRARAQPHAAPQKIDTEHKPTP